MIIGYRSLLVVVFGTQNVGIDPFTLADQSRQSFSKEWNLIIGASYAKPMLYVSRILMMGEMRATHNTLERHSLQKQ